VAVVYIYTQTVHITHVTITREKNLQGKKFTRKKINKEKIKIKKNNKKGKKYRLAPRLGRNRLSSSSSFINLPTTRGC
jgi:hypothetical protein